MVLLQFSWRIRSQDSRGRGVKCLLANDFTIILSIILTSAILERMFVTTLLIFNVKLNLFSSKDTFVIRFFI